MENASKALLMAGGVLIGILIITLVAILFLSGNEFFKSYNDEKTSEEVQRFNSNFIQYVGQELSIYQVVTICNFANENNVDIISNEKNKESIDPGNIDQIYKITIVSFSDEGYVKSIKFDNI